MNFYKNISNYCDEIEYKIYQFEQNPFPKNTQGISKIYHDVLSLKIFSQNKPQVKNLNPN